MGFGIYDVTIFIVLLTFSILIFRKLSSWNMIDRVLASTLPLLLLISVNAVLVSILRCPTNEWCHNRLAPAFALSHGYRFFNSLDSGPILTWMYGPLTAIVYLPATLLHSPTSAIAIAIMIGVLFFFAPIFGFSIVSANHRKPQGFRAIVFSLLIFLGAVFLVVTKYDNLAAAAFMIHADAPSLGLAGAACAVLYFRRSNRGFIPLLLSATFAILSIWTKQNLLPLPFALLTYVVMAGGYKVFKQYVLCFLLAVTVISSVFILVFGVSYLHFTMLEWPASWPWAADSMGLIPGNYATLTERLVVLRGATNELIRYALPLVVIILGYAVYQFKQAKYSSLSAYLNQNRWTLLVIVSLFMLPIAVVSRVKLGGGTYSLSVALYFLLCAVTAIVAETAAATVDNPSPSTQTKAIKLFALLIITVLALRGFKTDYSPLATPRFLAQFLNSPLEQAYQYDQAHPGQVYFPDFPLAAIMAEGKLYHSSLGLFDRRFYESVNYAASSDLLDQRLLERFAVRKQHFQENVPSHFEFVAFPSERRMNAIIMSYLPDFSRRVTIDGLPTWIVYTKK